MKPARTLLSKDLLPIDFARLQLGDRGVSAIITSPRLTRAEAALCKIEAVARRAAHAVVLHPAHQRLVHAALVNEILKEPPDRIIGERRDDRGVQAEATLQPACDVVFPAAFAHFKGSRRCNPPVSRVEPHHDLAQTDQVPAAIFFWLDRQRHAPTSAARSKLKLLSATFSSITQNDSRFSFKQFKRSPPAPSWESEYGSRQEPPNRRSQQSKMESCSLPSTARHGLRFWQ